MTTTPLPMQKVDPRAFAIRSPLLGRERDLARLVALFREDGVRLVTVTGAGGIGKTRLVIEAAELLRPLYTDGVVFVSLAEILDPDLVIPTIAQAVGVTESVERTLIEQLQSALANASIVIVLDNVEQVVVATPAIVDLLATCPGVAVLATSRGTLHLSGEYEFPLAPLAVIPSNSTLSPEQIGRLPSVQLFTERAQASGRAVELTDGNIRVVAEICRRVDGLPLAIELAAARSKMLSPAALLARLDRRLPILTAGNRNQPVRQQTLRNAIAWSYDLLQPEEQSIFRALAVFVGGFTLASAEHICASLGPQVPDILDSVSALIDKGLLTVVDDQSSTDAGESRFQMLETIREFALDLLVEHGESAAVMESHARYMLAVAESAEATFLRGDDVPWISSLAAEQGNIRAALTWAIDQQNADLALRLVASVHWFWFARGQFSEGRSWLQRALSADWTLDVRTTARSRALFAAGMEAHYQGDTAQVATYLAECEVLSRVIGDDTSLGRSLLLRGVAQEDAGAYESAGTLLDEALTLFRKRDDRLWSAQTLVHRGVVAFGSGDLAQASAQCLEGIAVYQTVGGKLGAAVGIAGALDTLSLIALANHSYQEALDYQRQALTMRVDLGNDQGVASSLAGFASIAAALSQLEVAAQLFGAAEALRETIGVVLAYPERTVYDRAISTIQAVLLRDRFVELWQRGRDRTVDEMISVARDLRIQSHGKQVQPSQDTVEGLTPREIEILRLIAGGATDKQIGEQLFISHRTVMRHATNIYGKLGINSRSAVTAYAYRHGLLSDPPTGQPD